MHHFPGRALFYGAAIGLIGFLALQTVAPRPAEPAGAARCQSLQGLLDQLSADGFDVSFLGHAEGIYPAFVAVGPHGGWQIFTEALPGLACLVVLGSPPEAPPDPDAPSP
jgi:hypothetical protein